jgi:hypothetical protein
LFGHNFCSLLLSIKFKIKHLNPDTRICSQSKSCTVINFSAFYSVCTATLRQCLRAGIIYRDKIRDRKSACTAIAPARNRNLYPDCKNCAMPRSLRLWWDYHHSQDTLFASIRLSTTNALYCRAVSFNGMHIHSFSITIKKILHCSITVTCMIWDLHFNTGYSGASSKGFDSPFALVANSWRETDCYSVT